jgi:CDP-diglyceride synthetase
MNDLLNLLKKLAPALATAVAGPAGGLVVSAIAEKFGVKDTVDEVARAIAGDPEATLKLAQIDLEKLKLAQQNTIDARDMQKIALQQDDVFSKRFTMYLTMFWSFTATIYIAFITFSDIPSQNVRFADTILGFILGTVIATVLNFWFGSSDGSKKKAEILEHLQK